MHEPFIAAAIPLVFASAPIALATEDTFWQDRACTEIGISEGAGLVWCTDAVVVTEERFELQVSWRGFGLSGKSLHKDPDTGNRKMYLKDSQGRRYDHVATFGALQGRWPNRRCSSHSPGRLVFPSVPATETFSFHDDDQNLSAGITLSSASRTDPETSASLLGHVSRAVTLVIDYREEDGRREQFRLTRAADGFEVEVEGAAMTMNLVPLSTVESFLSGLARSPLLARKLIRRPADDRFGASVQIVTPSGNVSFGSNRLGPRSWVVEIEEAIYMIPDDAPTRALSAFEVTLGRDPASRAQRALTLHVGAERASAIWEQVASRLGTERGYELARRVAELLDNENDADEVWSALEDYLEPPPRPSEPKPATATATVADEGAPAGEPALVAAVLADRAEAVRALLAAGANTEARSRDSETALSLAAAANRSEMVTARAESGAEIDVRGRYRMTPLMMASQNGHGETVAVLLDAGADPNVRSLDGGTALGLAASGQHAGVVRLLLAAHADPNLSESGAETPLMKARTPTVARALLRAGARVNASDSRGITALMKVASGDDLRGTRRVRPVDLVATVRELISAGADVGARDVEGKTALLWATKGVPGGTNDPSLIPPLIEAGSDVNARDRDDATPLFYVVVRGDEQSTRTLIAAGCDVSARVGNLSPMDVAIQYGHSQIAPLLLRAGARR